MFARILEFGVKLEKKAEFIKVLKNQVVPILKRETGFVEILPFFPETPEVKAINISLWNTRADAEHYAKETYPAVLAMVKPFLTTPVTTKLVMLETTVCEHFVESLVA
ncbi:MAG TPA: hypothetical protein VJA94_25625 [Candidatus Angelobacter sp.]